MRDTYTNSAVVSNLPYDGYSLPSEVVEITDYQPSNFVRNLGAKRRQRMVSEKLEEKAA